MRSTKSMSVMIVENNSMIRDAYVRLLRRDMPSVTFIECDSSTAAVSTVTADQPVLMVILNYDLAGGQSLKGLGVILRHYETVPVVLVDAPENAQIAVNALNSGASGYIVKSMRSECVLQSLRLVMLGEKYLPSFCAAGHALGAPEALGADGTVPGLGTPIGTLSPRRRQILTMVAAGAPNKVIARALSVHEVTVKSHLRVIFRTLGVNTRTQAARLAMCAGLGLPETSMVYDGHSAPPTESLH